MAVPELLPRTCPSCGQTYELPWLVTDYGDGNCQIEQLIEDERVHDCRDRIVKLELVRG